MVDAILPCQCGPVFGTPCPDVEHARPGQPGLGVFFSAPRRTITALVQVVLRSRAIADVSQRRNQLSCWTVPDLLTWRARTDKCCCDERMNMPHRALPVSVEDYRWVPVPENPGQKLSSALTPKTGLGTVAPAPDAPYPAQAADLVQTLVSGYRQPALSGSILRHSRSSIAVRPGRCSSQRGRAVAAYFTWSVRQRNHRPLLQLLLDGCSYGRLKIRDQRDSLKFWDQRPADKAARPAVGAAHTDRPFSADGTNPVWRCLRVRSGRRYLVTRAPAPFRTGRTTAGLLSDHGDLLDAERACSPAGLDMDELNSRDLLRRAGGWSGRRPGEVDRHKYLLDAWTQPDQVSGAPLCQVNQRTAKWGQSR